MDLADTQNFGTRGSEVQILSPRPFFLISKYAGTMAAKQIGRPRYFWLCYQFATQGEIQKNQRVVVSNRKDKRIRRKSPVFMRSKRARV